MTDIARTKPLAAEAEIMAQDADGFALLLGRAGRRIRAGRLSVVTPKGARFTFTGPKDGPSARVVLHRWRGLADMALNASVGLGRSYARGDWDTPDLTGLITFLAHNTREDARPTALARAARRLRSVATRLRPNERRVSRKNIAFHYDIGNDFYRRWLDPSWTYSSAIFDQPQMTLEEAQYAKYRRIAESLRIKPGDRVLEIGCGWGGFALFAAREYGARVTGLTLSREQLSFAGQRARQAGLDGQVAFHLRDYREETGQYDHVVSIEMLEAVGEAYWPAFFDTVASRLAPGGRAAIQSIVIEPRAFARYRRGADFIQSCIFPGGMLPTAPIIADQAAGSGLRLCQDDFFGLHYARTLKLWRRNFAAAETSLAEQGYDRRFRRLWDFYLAYCEGGFRAGRVDVGQWVFEKPRPLFAA